MSAQNYVDLHRKAIVVDTHGDVLHLQIENGLDLGVLQAKVQFDLPRAKEGGLDVQVFAVWSDAKGNFKLANRQIDSLYALIARNPDKIALVKDAKSLIKAVNEDKLAAMIGVEGGHMIDNDLDNIDRLAARGMTYLTLTWNNSTSWASSAADERSGKLQNTAAGLNDFGKKVIERLNKLGVMIDLSHVGEKTFFDALKYSAKPVLVSHSSVYALNPVPRNLTDEQILAIGKNKGVISLNFYSGFLDPQFEDRKQEFIEKHKVQLDSLSKILGKNKALDKLLELHAQEASLLGPPISVLVEHIDYIVKLIGIDHVGLGADFDGAESFPIGMNSVADFPKITEALLQKGYSAQDVNKILGGNFIRLLKDNNGR